MKGAGSESENEHEIAIVLTKRGTETKSVTENATETGTVIGSALETRNVIARGSEMECAAETMQAPDFQDAGAVAEEQLFPAKVAARMQAVDLVAAVMRA